MTPAQLSSSRESVQLLDVRLGDDYEACHLAGAANDCVFEVGFTDRVAVSAPDKSKVTVIYGENEASHEAAAAFGKLLRAGYNNLHVLEGGIEAALRDGFPYIKGKPLPSSGYPPQGNVPVDTDESFVGWTGRNLLKKHHGTVGISSGLLRFEKGELVTGEFALNLNEIKCADLEGTSVHDVLIDHLRSDDFLDAENFPEAVFVITKVERISQGDGAPNLHIRGGLTIRGETHPVEFDATTGFTPEGMPAAQAVFTIDRTRWGIIYGSGKFFHRLAGHLVNDLIEIEIKIVGKRS